MAEDNKETFSKGRYDNLMQKIEITDDPVFKVEQIKLLDQELIIEEGFDIIYSKKKVEIHSAYETVLKPQKLAQVRKKGGNEKDIDFAIAELELGKWNEIYAQIKALLYRSGYYAEVKYDKTIE